MAGYRITFDGSLNERKDVPQVTAGNSLTSSTQNSPVDPAADSWEMGVTYPSNTTSWPGGTMPNVYGRAGLTVPTNSNGSTITTSPSSNGVFGEGIEFWTPTNNICRAPAGALQISWEIDYIRVFTSSGVVTITPSTVTPGVAPTGGTATTATPSTIQDGSAGAAGPAKLFGAKVVHDSSDIVQAKYLPPADNSQDAEATVSSSEIITATATTLSVESEGLGGAEKLAAQDTALTVKEFTDAVEN